MTGPRYPNQQLEAVSLETYFPGRFSMFSRMSDIQDALVSELPHLYVPSLRDGEAFALRPYELRSADDLTSLAVAINQLSFVSRSYPGYEEFVDTAIKVLKHPLAEMGVSDISRVIYKYQNKIGVLRKDDGTLPLGEIFGEAFGSIFGSSAATQIETSWTHRTDDGLLSVALAADPDSPFSSLRLVIAGIIQPAGPVSALASYAAMAHERASKYFESIISEEFRQTLAGGPRDDDGA